MTYRLHGAEGREDVPAVVLGSIDEESNGVVEYSEQKPQQKKNDTICKVESGASETKLK